MFSKKSIAGTVKLDDTDWALARELQAALKISAKDPDATGRVVTHHIVARNSKFAKAAREALERVGIGIEDAVNKTGVPEVFHRGMHQVEGYFEIVNRIMSPVQTKEQVVEALERIGAAIEQAVTRARESAIAP